MIRMDIVMISCTMFINVDRDFSVYPGGRTREEGDASAEEFLELIKYALDKCNRVIIDLDGTRGYGSSFLNEVARNLSEEDCERIIFICSRAIYLKELMSYNSNIMAKQKEYPEEVDWDKIIKTFKMNKQINSVPSIYHS